MKAEVCPETNVDVTDSIFEYWDFIGPFYAQDTEAALTEINSLIAEYTAEANEAKELFNQVDWDSTTISAEEYDALLAYEEPLETKYNALEEKVVQYNGDCEYWGFTPNDIMGDQVDPVSAEVTHP